MIGGSEGGGGHTNESIMSSVTRIIPTKSGGSVRDDLFIFFYYETEQKNKLCDVENMSK